MSAPCWFRRSFLRYHVTQYIDHYKQGRNARIVFLADHREPTLFTKNIMKELSSLDLRSVSGGSHAGTAILHALGNVSSTIGYMLAVQIKRTVGINVSGTIEGVTAANVISGFTSHSMWDDQSVPVDERMGSGLATSLLCGAAVGIFEEVAKTAISHAMQDD